MMKSITSNSILLGVLSVLLLLTRNGSAFVSIANRKLPSSSSSSLLARRRTHDAAEETFTGIYKGYYDCIYNIPGDYPPASSIVPWDQQPANSGAYFPPSQSAIGVADQSAMPETKSKSYKNSPAEN